MPPVPSRAKPAVVPSNRSIVTPLLTICASMVGATLVGVTLCASALSLWLGYQELSRRGDCAIMMIEHALGAKAGAAPGGSSLPPLAELDVDPDVLAALVTDASGRTLFSFRKPDARAGEAADALAKRSDEPSHVVIAEQTLVHVGEAAHLAIVYDATPAWRRAAKQLTLYSLGTLVALAAAIAALRFMFARQMKPMRELARATVELASERYEAAVPGIERTDEIGVMARAIDSFKTRLVDRARLRADAEIETHRSAERHSRIDERVDAFRSTIGRSLHEVGGLSDQMQVAADGLASIAAQTTLRADSAVSAIRQTSANVGTVAEASEDLSASIREIERQVDQTREIVAAATRSTAETSNVIKGLFQKTEKIDEIIGLIQAIAAQTNLLALNATIEAARAGESGRGFAVVAQEVKSLANQTAHASNHVADHIRAIQEATSQAVEAIGTIDATMAQAEQYSAVIAVAVERQATASTAITRNAADAAKAAGDAADSMKRLAAAIGETDQSAAQLHQSASDVGQQAHDLSTTIDAFLSDTASLREETPPVAA